MTTDLRDGLAKIESPVLLIAAGASTPTPEGRARLRQSYEAQVAPIPDHRVVLADHSRHFIMLDTPDFFHAILTDFLADFTGQEAAQ